MTVWCGSPLSGRGHRVYARRFVGIHLSLAAHHVGAGTFALLVVLRGIGFGFLTISGLLHGFDLTLFAFGLEAGRSPIVDVEVVPRLPGLALGTCPTVSVHLYIYATYSMQMLICPGCHQPKRRSEYHRSRARSTGLSYLCAECERQRQRSNCVKNAALNEERYAIIDEAEVYRCCRGCGDIKPLTAYHRHAATATGYSHFCCECANRKQRVMRLRATAEYRARKIAACYVG
jgi:hypothetical protein